MRQLKHLCQDDPGALDAIDRGNANTYALRKLRKDRPDLHERVLAEEVSPHAALCAHIKKRS